MAESKRHYLVIDDHPLVRAGVRQAILHVDREAQVHEAESLTDGADICLDLPEIELVLLDLGLPGMTGVEAFQRFRRQCSRARVVVISATYNLALVRHIIQSGGAGYIPKRHDAATFTRVLKFILEGGRYVPPEALYGPILHDETHDSSVTHTLTPRQRSVLMLMMKGYSNRQICGELNLALGTVKCHVAAILHALQVGSRSEAVAQVHLRGEAAEAA
ncbi:MAG: response regulator transcription factor [Burkholderiaceae bacterium]